MVFNIWIEDSVPLRPPGRCSIPCLPWYPSNLHREGLGPSPVLAHTRGWGKLCSECSGASASKVGRQSWGKRCKWMGCGECCGASAGGHVVEGRAAEGRATGPVRGRAGGGAREGELK